MVRRFRNVMDSVVQKAADLNADDQYGRSLYMWYLRIHDKVFCEFRDV